MTVEMEFECYNTGETIFGEGIPHDDGGGYWDVKMKESCPYCGEHHWEQATIENF